jgi:spore germination protein PC
LNYQYNQHVQMLEQRVRNLEANQQNLYQQYISLKNQFEQIKPVHIENINYKIQELNVKELTGTLNIGLTTFADEDQLKKMMEDVNKKEDIHLEDLDQSQQEKRN